MLSEASAGSLGIHMSRLYAKFPVPKCLLVEVSAFFNQQKIKRLLNLLIFRFNKQAKMA